MNDPLSADQKGNTNQKHLKIRYCDTAIMVISKVRFITNSLGGISYNSAWKNGMTAYI